MYVKNSCRMDIYFLRKTPFSAHHFLNLFSKRPREKREKKEEKKKKKERKRKKGREKEEKRKGRERETFSAIYVKNSCIMDLYFCAKHNFQQST